MQTGSRARATRRGKQRSGFSRALRPALYALLLLGACAEIDPVVRTIDRVVEAAEDRDAAEIVQSLSSGYEGRAEVERELRRYLFGYERVDITVRELQSDSAADGGWATFTVDFSGVPKQAAGLDQFLPRSATYRFAIDLVTESGDWKIAKAQWERIR